MAQRTVVYGYYDGKKVVSASGISTSQTVTSQGVKHNMGDLTVLQEVLTAGAYSDKVSIYVRGDLAMVCYMTTGQFTVFETAVMPTLGIIGSIAPHAFDLL